VGVLILAAPASAVEMQLAPAYSVTGHYAVLTSGVGGLTGGNGTMTPGNIPGSINKSFFHWSGVNLPHDVVLPDSAVTLTRHGPGTFEPNSVVASTITPIEFEMPFSPGNFYWDAVNISYTADVTSLVTPGDFQYDISDFDMSDESGAALQTVYQDASLPLQEITIYNGADFAYANWAGGGELNRTHVLSHTFAPAAVARTLHLDFIVANGATSARPDQLWFQTGTGVAPTELVNSASAVVLNANPLNGNDGEDWDTVRQTVTVPAGATFVSFQFQSGGGTGDQNLLPESFTWLSAALSFSVVPEPASLSLLIGGALAMGMRRNRGSR
jgi:hypothetical protein